MNTTDRIEATAKVLSSAESLIAALQCALFSSSGTPSPEMLANSLAGVSELIAGARKNLELVQVAS